MDYIRIYEAFIKDRRAKEPTLTGYTERHHILPRSMGGGDEPDNLVALTPEDHFFAHLLLAKVHNSRPMWGAVMLMLGSRRAGVRKQAFLRRMATKWRVRYGAAKRNLALVAIGENAANADLQEYNFFHENGDTFVGTRIAFGSQTAILPENINPLVRGVIQTSNGWAMCPSVWANRPERRSETARQSGLKLKGFTRRPELRCFYSDKLGISVIASQKGMIALGYLNKSQASSLSLGDKFQSNGWCLLENAEWAFDRAGKRGKYGGAFNSQVYELKNAVTGDVFVGTIWDAGQKFNSGDSRAFGELVRGGRSGFRGWHLASAAPPKRVQNLPTYLRCIKSGKIIKGTRVWLASSIGVTPSAISNLVNGRCESVRGWVFEKAEGDFARRA